MTHTPKKTLFISDLHLDQDQPQITQQFLHLLKSCDASVDALYILGDLFEAWIGDDNNTPFHRDIIRALKTASDCGLAIFFIHGNRDFLIGKQFSRASGCQLLSEEEKITVYGTPVLLMHGDTLCTLDHAYLQSRKKMRHPLLQKLFLFLPLTIRKKIADKMRTKSKLYTQSVAATVMDVTQEEVERVMHKHNVTVLIHGHTHRPGFHEFSLNNHPAVRIVLGAWHERGNALLWDELGNREWLTI